MSAILKLAAPPRVVLPPFQLFEPAGAKYPNRHHVLAEWIRADGLSVRVIANWPRRKWWIYSAKAGFRMSGTLRTSSPTLAAQWIEAVDAGRVDFDRRIK